MRSSSSSIGHDRVGIDRRSSGAEQRVAGGFTLIELLAVVAIIALLAAVVLGGGRWANEAGKVAKARAELAALAAGLEAYKRTHGDYPHTADPAEMLQALIGKRGPTGAGTNRRTLIDLAHFTTAGGEDAFVTPNAQLVDPWQRPYRYCYKTGTPTAWKAPGFVLYSSGGDGVDEPPDASTGFVNSLSPANADNFYASR